MPLFSYSSTEVSRNLQANPASHWYGDDTADTACAQSRLLVSERLREPWFTPRLTPTLQLSKRDHVFCIGSCFARHVEDRLARVGLNVESVTQAFDEYPVREGRASHCMNKYNTFSILNSLRWALDPLTSYPVDSLVEIETNLYFDPHLHPTLDLTNRLGTLERRRRHDEVIQRVAACRVVVVTLGLTEAWRDEWTGLYVNGTPSLTAQERDPGRFTFHILDYEENFANLEAVHEVLSGVCPANAEIVVSVSPVSLRVTFGARDIVLANTCSKATLRAVAEAWSSRHPNVHYFPSYEIVLNSNRDLAFAGDTSHVTPAMVDHVMGIFLESHGLGALSGS